MKQQIHLDILDKEQQCVFKKLYKILKGDYYLSGGTALALQIHHRKSLDFDLFKNADIKFSLKQKIFRGFGDYSIQTLVDTSDELSLVLNKKLKISFINYFWDPIFPLIRIPETIPLLSVKDIATTKSYALGRRGNYRDYFDLYVILKNKYATLKNIIKWCSEKYGDIFSERMFLEQLTYLEDINDNRNLLLLDEKYIPPKQIIDYFKEKIQELRKHK